MINRNKTKGAFLLIEALIVFPISFIVVILMLMLGDMYLTYSRIERMVVETTIEITAACENPMTQYISNKKAVPTSANDRGVKIYPYRYIFTGNIRSICDDYEKKLSKEIKDMKSLAFGNLKLKLRSVNIEPRLYYIYSDVVTECEFYYELPYKIPFTDEPLISDYKVSFTRVIGDPAEFVRNAGLVADIFERSETIQKYVSKIGPIMRNIFEWLN